MSRTKIVEGNKGEGLAIEFLKTQGYKILERNFRIRGGEIDIIAIDDDTLAFIEVKTRTSNQFGTPFESITFWKMKALIRAAEFYKVKHPNLPDAMRIDAVSVMFDELGKPQLELVKNIS